MTDKDLSVLGDVENILPLKIADGLCPLDTWEEITKRLRMVEALADTLAQQMDRDTQNQFVMWLVCDLMNQALAFHARLHTDLTQMMKEQRAAAAADGEGQL